MKKTLYAFLTAIFILTSVTFSEAVREFPESRFLGNIFLGSTTASLQKELRFYEGTNYVALKAGALVGDQVWILPTEDGTVGQVIKTDGNGNLGWTSSTGQTNTASNVGTVGVGIFKQKTLSDLELYKLYSTNNILSLALNGTDRIDFTINNGNIDHDVTLNYVASEHIDWTNTSEDLSTTGDGSFDEITVNTINPETSTVILDGDLEITQGLTVNSTSLFVNYINGRVGVGTITPSVELEVEGSLIVTGSSTLNGLTLGDNLDMGGNDILQGGSADFSDVNTDTINPVSTTVTINGDLEVTGDGSFDNISGNSAIITIATIDELDSLDKIQFDLAPTQDCDEGCLMWDANDGTGKLCLPGGNVCVQIGLEGLVKARNTSGSDIKNGNLVYTVGSQGQLPLIDLADYSDSDKIYILGMATEDIDNNSNGYVAIWGKVRGSTLQPIDTSSYIAGTKLYMSSAGTWSDTHPVFPNAVVLIGEVQNQHAIEGVIMLTNPKYFTIGNNYDGILRQSVINKSTGVNAGSSFTVINDQEYRGSFTIIGSNNSVFPPNGLAIYNEGYGATGFMNAGNVDFRWFSDPTDSHDYSALNNEIMTLTASGDLLIHSGSISIGEDSKKLYLGTSQDASMYYDGDSLNFTSTGLIDFTDENLVTTGNISGNFLLDTIDGSVYTDVQDWMDVTQSSGKISGGTFGLTNGDGTLSVSSGSGLIRASSEETARVMFFDWSQNISVSLVDGQTNYIYVDYNNGSPIVGSTTNKADCDNRDCILLGKIYREGIILHEVEAGMIITELARRVLNYLNSLHGEIVRFSGLTTTETGNLNVAITSGTGSAGLTPILATTWTSFDSSGADTFRYWLNDNTGWVSSDVSVINATQYNNYGVGLANLLNNNHFGCHFVYQHFENDKHIIYGINTYATLADAVLAPTPANLPNIVSDFSIYIGKIIVKKTETSSFTDVLYPWTDTTTTGLTGSHAGLSDLGWLNALHTGTINTFAGFDGSGNATNYTESDYGKLGDAETITGNWVNTDNPWDISSETNLIGGTNITLLDDTLNVDDFALKNSESDQGIGTLEMDGFTLGQSEVLTMGTGTVNHDGADFVFDDTVKATGFEGDLIGKADTADILQTARTIAGVSFDGSANINLASTGLSDTADLLYEAELNTFSLLQAQISDKTLINEEDEITFDIFPITPSSAPDADYEVANKKYVDDNVGTGDVSKVGTPVNNQVGVWTGDGTLEGDVDFTFDGSDLTIDGAVITTGSISIDADNGKLYFGDGQDSSIYYDATDLVIKTQEAGSGDLIVLDGHIGLGTSSPDEKLEVNNTIVFTSEYNAGTTTPYTVDWGNGNKQTVTLNASTCTVNFTNPAGGVSNFLLRVNQDGTGSRTVGTWDTDIKWPSGTAPTLTTDASAIDIVSCYWNGTNYFCNSSLDFQ